MSTCPDCHGTGADAAKTADARKRGHCDSRSYMTYQLPFVDPYEDWRRCETDDFKPNARQQVAMDSVSRALAAGLFYTTDVRAFCAKDLAISPEIDADKRSNVEGGTFGYDLYYARRTLDAQKRLAALRVAADSLKLAPGLVLGTLIFNDYKVTRQVTVVEVWPSGHGCSFTCKRGASTATGKGDALQLKYAIDRAIEKGKRKD